MDGSRIIRTGNHKRKTVNWELDAGPKQHNGSFNVDDDTTEKIDKMARDEIWSRRDIMYDWAVTK